MKSLLRHLLMAAGTVILALAAGCSHLPSGAPAPQPAQPRPGDIRAKVPSAVKEDHGISSDQLVVVLGEGEETSRARLFLLERRDGKWELKRGPVKAMVGRKGFAAPGQKREGDGRTPAGLFPLESLFGSAPSVTSAMPYRQTTGKDLWVDDVNSPDYNTWVTRGATAAASFEELNRYRHGIIIGYNRNPVLKGNGSAIFVHAWSREGSATAGCVSIAEAELLGLMAWLDPSKKPMILMGTRSEVAALMGARSEVAATIGLDAVAAGPPAVMDDLERQVRGKIGAAAERLVEYRGEGGYFGMAVTVPKALEQEMRLKRSWHEGCPVVIGDLSYMVLCYWGFDGKAHVGELVLHRKLALATIKAFGELFAQRFPIEKMERIERYDANDDQSMADNNTSAFNCREVTGQPGVFSKHSYGTAIDINPVQNPYLIPKSEALQALGWKGRRYKADFLEKLGYPHVDTVARYCSQDAANCQVLPPNGFPFLDRSKPTPGMLVPGPIVKVFTRRGFEWGGAWRSSVDYQHFQVKPRKLK